MNILDKDIYKKIGLKWVKCCGNCEYCHLGEESSWYCSNNKVGEGKYGKISIGEDNICNYYEMDAYTKDYIKQFEGEIL